MKDYDSTLARIAGNIAGPIAATFSSCGDDLSESAVEGIADDAMKIAKRIVEKCKEDYAKLPAQTLQK